MNTRNLQAGIGALFAPDSGEGMGVGTPSVARLFDHSPELTDAAEQVASEQRGRVLMVARHSDACRWLLAHLRQQPLVPDFRRLTREGLFTLACLHESELPDAEPGEGGEDGIYDWSAGADAFDLLTEELLDADLVLLLITAKPDVEPDQVAYDTRTFARLRSSGVPVLPVLLRQAQEAGESDLQDTLRRMLGVQPVLLTAPAGGWAEETGPAQSRAEQKELLALIDRMLATRPRLSIPLAQEVPFCRSLIASRVIRTAAWMTAMVGMEPIPIIDLPLQVALQWKVILQIAAIYGRPGLDVRSKEMAGTVGVSVLMRLLTQQMVKLLPVVGWMLSGLLSGLSTLLIGHAFLRYYEYDRIVDLQAVGSALQRGAQRTLSPVRTARRHLHLVHHRRGGNHA